MSLKLLTEHNLEFLSLKGGWKGSSESPLVKMPHCYDSIIVCCPLLICTFFCHYHKLNIHACFQNGLSERIQQLWNFVLVRGEDPNTTISRSSSARQRSAVNADLVTLWFLQGIRTSIAKKPGFSGGGGGGVGVSRPHVAYLDPRMLYSTSPQER